MLRASSFLCVLFLSNQGAAEPSEQLAAGEGPSSEGSGAGEPSPPAESEGIPLKLPPPAEQTHEQQVEERPSAARPRQNETAVGPASSSEARAPDPRGPERDSDEGEGDTEEEESPQFAYFGIGPTAIGISSYDEYGVALAVGGRFPFHERMAMNAGLTLGLTSFWRTEEVWDDARQLGSWTTRAYGNVTRWAGEGEDDEGFRFIAAFYAYIGLLFPYALSGIMYAVGPLAATSYADFHMEASFHLLETRKGPYVAAGLGTIAFVHPIHGELKGGIGPSFGAGYDFGWFGVEARGFVSPRYLHGESTAQRTDVFTGSFLLRLQGK